MYTLQTQYLAKHDVQLSNFAAAAVSLLGLSGYVLFRSVNDQKDMARRTKGQCIIWGRKAVFLKCTYTTSDGKQHETLLLTSGTSQSSIYRSLLMYRAGWWGLARHANYVGDLMLSYAMCAACGTHHLLPWFYAVYMTAILVHRCFRDEQRCRTKYGRQWAEYCKLVPWRLIPGIW